MADYMGVDLRGSRFERVDLSGAELLVVDLNEEWEHRRYAERDLQALEEHHETREPS
jgi:uncharacterized protein YjbI with pentapeptide repeats